MAPINIARTSSRPDLGDADRAGERQHHDEAEDDLGETLERIEDAVAGRAEAHGLAAVSFWKSSIASASIVKRSMRPTFSSTPSMRSMSRTVERASTRRKAMPRLVEFRLQREKHVRAGHVDHGRSGEIADDEADRLGRGVEPREHGVEDVLGVEIDDAGLDAEGEHAGRRFVVGVALAIRVAPRAGDAAEEGDVRRRGAADEQHHRDDGADEHALEQARPTARRASAVMATRNSPRCNCQSRLSTFTFTRLATAMSTMAASTGCGRLRSRSVKKSATTRMMPAAIKPESGVRAPPLSLTSDCDMPPLIGKPWPRPEARLAPASARNSWLLSSR